MSFKELTEQKYTGLILFYGTACAPCERLKPRLMKGVAARGVSLEQINVAGDMEAVRGLGIRGVPTLVDMNQGKPEILFTGEVSDEVLNRVIDRASLS